MFVTKRLLARVRKAERDIDSIKMSASLWNDGHDSNLNGLRQDMADIVQQHLQHSIRQADRMMELEKSVAGMRMLFDRLADTNKRIDLILDHLGLAEEKVKPHTRLVSKSEPEGGQ